MVCVHICNSLVMSDTYCFPADTHYLSLIFFLSPFPWWSLGFGIRWRIYHYLFKVSYLYPFSFCFLMISYLLLIKAFLFEFSIYFHFSQTSIVWAFRNQRYLKLMRYLNTSNLVMWWTKFLEKSHAESAWLLGHTWRSEPLKSGCYWGTSRPCCH